MSIQTNKSLDGKNFAAELAMTCVKSEGLFFATHLESFWKLQLNSDQFFLKLRIGTYVQIRI